MSPDIDALTYKEQLDNDNLGTAIISDVAETLIVTIPDFHDNAIIIDLKNENNSYKLKTYQLRRRIKTRVTCGILENSSQRFSDALTVEANNMNPVSLLAELFTKSVYDMIVQNLVN